MSGTSRKAIPDIREKSRGSLGGSGRFGRPFRRSGQVGKISLRSGAGREALLEVRDGSGGCPGVRDESGGLPVDQGRVGRPFWRFWPSQKTFPKVRDRSEGPTKVWDGSGGLSRGPKQVGRSSLRFGTVWKALPEVRDGSGGPPGGSGRVRCLLWRSEKGREAIPNVRETITEVQVGLGGFSGEPDGPPGSLGGPHGGSEVLPRGSGSAAKILERLGRPPGGSRQSGGFSKGPKQVGRPY